jgi:hypothetical protein
MNAEYERVFSFTKFLLIYNRARMKAEIIEVNECFKT